LLTGGLLAVGSVSRAAPINPLTGVPDPSGSELVFWLDSSDAGTLFKDVAGTVPVTTNGDLVALWKDKSASGNDVSQGTVTRRPTYNASLGSMNNRPSVLNTGGSGSDATALSATNGTGIVGNGDRTVATVWQNTAFTGQNFQHTLHFGDASMDGSYGHSTSRGGGVGSPIGNHYWGSGFDSTATASINPNFALSYWDGNGGLDQWYVNGADKGTHYRGALNTGTDQLQIGSRINPFTEGFMGHLLEVVMWNEVLTQDDINRFGGYIQAKYGITVENSIPPIPEPPTLMLLATAAVGLLLFVRRRRAHVV
jgi:hypothetical protein